MTEKILLPIDVTHPHPEFFPLLDQFISLKGTAVHLLYVREELPALENMLRTLADSPEELGRQLESQSMSVLNSIKAKLEAMGATVTTEIVGGPAAMMIEAVARDEGFHLTVITSGSADTVDKFLLGRVSAKVVRHAPGTVLLLRGRQDTKLANIVVGLDGSEHGFNALRQAIQLFSLKEKGIAITAVNVVSVTPLVKMFSPVTFASAVEGNLQMSGETVLAEGEKIAKELGIDQVEMVLKEGNPETELIKVAQEKQAGAIVVGSQGKGAVAHFLLGSTSTRLASHSPCPVAIFKGEHGKGN